MERVPRALKLSEREVRPVQQLCESVREKSLTRRPGLTSLKQLSPTSHARHSGRRTYAAGAYRTLLGDISFYAANYADQRQTAPVESAFIERPGGSPAGTGPGRLEMRKRAER